jgi:hypothetical protein
MVRGVTLNRVAVLAVGAAIGAWIAASGIRGGGESESISPKRLQGCLDQNASKVFHGSFEFRTKSLNFCLVSAGIKLGIDDFVELGGR